jgi:hypothetical protein
MNLIFPAFRFLSFASSSRSTLRNFENGNFASGPEKQNYSVEITPRISKSHTDDDDDDSKNNSIKLDDDNNELNESSGKI